MIFITAKFRVKPEHADGWAGITKEFTDATRAEPGNLWFDWFRSTEDPNEFLLTEAFQDDAAAAHVSSDHFKQAMQAMPAALTETPRIINATIEGATDWSRMGEMTVD